MDNPPDPRTVARNIMVYYSTTTINKGNNFMKIAGMSGLTFILEQGMLEIKIILKMNMILA
jgi:hypothetical protein